MKFPDLLILVKTLEEEQRALALDVRLNARKLDDLRADILRALPEAKLWMGPSVHNGHSDVDGGGVS